MTDAVALALTLSTPRAFGPSALAGLRSIVTFAALIVLAGVVLLPIVATALGGFKDLGELHSNPIGLPHVWVWSNYWEHPDQPPILAGARQFAAHRFAHRRAHAGARFDGRLHLRPSALLRRPVPPQLHPAWTPVSGRDRDRADLHQGAGSRPAQFLLGRHSAAGRLLARHGGAACCATDSSSFRSSCSTRR